MTAIELTKTVTLNATAAHVWRILGDDFVDVSRWATSVTHSVDNPKAGQPVQCAPCGGRACALAGFGETDERLIAFDAARRTLAYTVTAKKLPSFVENMRNDWWVEDAGNGTTRVTSRISATARGPVGAVAAPMMRMKLRSTLGEILDDLRVYAETGSVSAAKQKSLAKSSKKAKPAFSAR